MPGEGDKPGFTIKDRRSFTESGEPRSEQGEAPAPPSPPQPGAEAPRERRLPPVDFGTFVLSLGSSALMHLGEVERPGTGQIERDLPMAKHTIDLLSMLQDKTKGNLTAQEAQLIESLLYDLRLRYVEALKRGG